MEPREYQADTVDRIVNRTRPFRLALESPTGSGKSFLMALIARYPLRHLILAHRSIIMNQTAAILQSMGLRFGFRASGYREDPDALIQLGMVQTEIRRRPHPNVDLVHIDEIHQQGGPAYRAAFNRYHSEGASLLGYTATPSDLGDLVEDVYQVATVPELIEAGYLCPPRVLSCGMPDVRLLAKLRRDAKGEYLAKDVNKIVKPQVIFGPVLQHYHQLTNGTPFVLFAHSVKASLYWAQAMTGAGVPTAHIDGNDVWVDYEFHKSRPDVRQEVFGRLEGGSLKGISNRFVLREGWDCPEVGHAILTCVKRGTKVLTDRGEIPIENVTVEDRVWDGVEFVSHRGAVCQGQKRVLSWDGLTATPEHKVLTRNGWCSIAEAAQRQEAIITAGRSGGPVRVFDDSNPHDSPDSWRSPHPGSSLLCGVWPGVLARIPENQIAKALTLPLLSHPSTKSTLPSVAEKSGEEMERALRETSKQELRQLRRPRYRISISECSRSGGMGCGESWRAGRSHIVVGSHQQRRTLRAGEFAMGHRIHANEESSAVCTDSSMGARLAEGLPVTMGGYSELACAEVWDIVDAGPRQRFTANGRLVANCPFGLRKTWVQACGRIMRPHPNREFCIVQDHCGSWLNHPPLDSGEPWDWRAASGVPEKAFISAMRNDKIPEPLVCPQCKGTRNFGDTCPFCGFRYAKTARFVQEADGTLRLIEGKTYQPRRTTRKPGDERIAERLYWSCVKHPRRTSTGAETWRTCEQAIAYYAYQHNWRWLPRDLPYMPINDGDFFLPWKEIPRDQLRPPTGGWKT